MPSGDAPLLSVVMPAYGELPNLRHLLPRLRVLSAQLGVALELLIVLPVEAPEAEMEEVRRLGGQPLRRHPTDSFGDAIRSGLAAIAPSAVAVVTMDADGSHSPETIARLWERRGDAHVVVASRYVLGGSSDNSTVLRCMSRSLNVVYSLVLGIRCRDISTNFKLYRAQDLRRVQLECNDFDVVEELLFAVRRLHGSAFRICEIPDRFHSRQHGVTKRRLGPFILSYLRTLLRLRLLANRRQG